MPKSTRELWYLAVVSRDQYAFRHLYERFTPVLQALTFPSLRKSVFQNHFDVIQDVWRTLLRTSPLVCSTLHARQILKMVFRQKAHNVAVQIRKDSHLVQRLSLEQSGPVEGSKDVDSLVDLIAQRLGPQAARIADHLSNGLSERAISGIESITVHHVRSTKNSIKSLIESHVDARREPVASCKDDTHDSTCT